MVTDTWKTVVGGAISFTTLVIIFASLWLDATLAEVVMNVAVQGMVYAIILGTFGAILYRGVFEPLTA